MAQSVKNPPAMQETQFDPWVGKIPWSREWQPTPVFLPGTSHGQRSLVGYSPWGHKSQTRLSNWTTTAKKTTNFYWETYRKSLQIRSKFSLLGIFDIAREHDLKMNWSMKCQIKFCRIKKKIQWNKTKVYLGEKNPAKITGKILRKKTADMGPAWLNTKTSETRQLKQLDTGGVGRWMKQ